jgi:DDE superfamily endonuclease
MLLPPRPWAQRVWALPCMTVLCPSERFDARRGRRAQTVVERAWQMIPLVVRWLPRREVVFVADSSYAALELLDHVKKWSRASWITRLRLDAALDDPPPRREPRQQGRPQLTGKRRATLEAAVTDDETPWTTLTVDQWYGKGPREVDVCTDTAVWYHAGKRPVPLRWMLIRDPKGTFKPQALWSTHLEHTPEPMLT